MIYDDISYTIGKTPLLKLSHIPVDGGNIIFLKTESRNPAGSIKDRIAYAMINDAEQTGALAHGMRIIEATSGNTGVALAAIGKAKGYKVTLVMPESMSVERRQLAKAFGAELILTPASEGMKGAIKRATTILDENPGKYYMPKQFENPANPAIHTLTTGPEIDMDTDGKVDAVVAGVGTGGTISGVGYYFKNIKKMAVSMVAVEPSLSPVITQTLSGEPIKPGPHAIQGIGAGFIPNTLDLGVVDHVVSVDNQEAIEHARLLMKEEGILCGISCGAAFAGALKAIRTLGWTNRTVVVVLPDSGERYLSTALFENI